MNRFEWSAPTTVAEAASSATTTMADAMAGAADAALVKAGGVDVLDLMKENLVAPRRLVNLKGITGLDGVDADRDGGIRIGAMARLATLAEHPLLRGVYAALGAAAAQAGSPQLRNLATIGGNILQRPHCWYFRSPNFACRRKGGIHCFALAGENQYHAIFDNDLCAIVHPSSLATALVALDASVELTDAQGRIRRLALESFFLAPEKDVTRENDLRSGEILTTICLPALPETARSVYVKQGEKAAFDWPLADIAVRLDLAPNGSCEGAAIVLGAAAPVPYRVRAAEALLVGGVITTAKAIAASQTAMAEVRPLAKNAYKLPIFAALLRRAIMSAASIVSAPIALD